MPAILGEEADIFIARVKGIELALVELARRADEEIGEINASLCAREDEAAIELRDCSGVDLVGVKLGAELRVWVPTTLANVSEPWLVLSVWMS